MKIRMELWLDFYKAALTGRTGRSADPGMSIEDADLAAAAAADLAMKRHDALEDKVMKETREMYSEANRHDGTLRLRDLWGSGTFVGLTGR